ncbi:hypothetical protein T439DRAFT_282416 [Meredithblackwellia eburnea MCA 4105]
MAAPPPRPFRQTSGSVASSASGDEFNDHNAHGPSFQQSGGGAFSGYSSSSPTLPRYSSGQSSSSYLSNPSPLNPAAAARGGGREGIPSTGSSRYSSYGYAGSAALGQGAHAPQSAHPLSNAMYLDSSPTLAGSDPNTPGDEKLRLAAADQLGDYIQPASAKQGGGAPANAPYRRGPQPTGLMALYRAISGASIGDSGKDERHIKLPRLGYLDGMKFIAAWVVLNGTLFEATLTNDDYTFIQRNSPLYILRSTGLGITFLLLLSGRSLVTPLWDVPTPNANLSAGGKVAKANTALISWARLTRAMLVRPFRFILPCLVIVAIQWGLGATNKTQNCNAVGMEEPYWKLISSFAGFSTLVFDLFTVYEADTLAGQTFAGNLWTMPWFFQGSFAVYVTHLMLGNLSSNRYWIYGVLAMFSWFTYNYFFVAFIGLAIADMHAHGHLHRIRTKWPMYQRLTLHLVLIAVALVTQWVPVVRDNINKGMAVINVQNHPELTFCDAIFASCWLFTIETSGLAQTVFGNVVMRNLGKLAAGLYLFAPIFTYTIIPDLALRLHDGGSKASSVLGVSWVVLFLAAFGVAILFHVVVELPSKLLGEVVAELLESADGSTRFTRKSKEGNNKLVKRHVGGGAKLQQQQQQRQPLQVSKPVLV